MKKKFTGEYWNTNWIVYSSLGVKTKSQKRRILNWYTKHDANIIGVQASNVHFKLKKVPGIKIPANIENNFDSRRERISTSHHIAKDTFSSHLGAFTFYLDWKSMVGQFLDPTNGAQSYDLESVQSRHWIENPARFEGETILFK